MGEATGKQIVMRGMTLAHVRHDAERGGYSFAEEWVYGDIYDMLKQLEVIPHRAGTTSAGRRLQELVPAATSGGATVVAHHDAHDEDGVSEAIGTVKRCIDYLWNYHELDMETVSSCLHDDFVSYDNLEEIRGIQNFIQYAKRRIKPFPKGVWYVDSIMAARTEDADESDIKVAVHYTFIGKNSADGFLSLPATKKQVNTGGLIYFTLRDGVIIESEEIHDIHNMLAQLGHIEKEVNLCGAKKRSEREKAIDRELKLDHQKSKGRGKGKGKAKKDL